MSTTPGSQFAIQLTYSDRRYDLHELADQVAALSYLGFSCEQVGSMIGHRSIQPLEPSGKVLEAEFQHAMRLLPRTVPQVQSLGLGSPLEAVLVATSTPAVIGFFVFALKRPELIGSWIPKIVASWHKEWQEVEVLRAVRDSRRGTELTHALEVNATTAIGSGVQVATDAPEDERIAQIFND